jgi:hypothetical protein
VAPKQVGIAKQVDRVLNSLAVFFEGNYERNKPALGCDAITGEIFGIGCVFLVGYNQESLIDRLPTPILSETLVLVWEVSGKLASRHAPVNVAMQKTMAFSQSISTMASRLAKSLKTLSAWAKLEAGGG